MLDGIRDFRLQEAPRYGRSGRRRYRGKSRYTFQFNRNETVLMPQLRLDDRLSKLGAAVRAFIGEVDLRHAPVRLDVLDEHRKPDTARTNDEGRLDVVVMMNIGWHLGTPRGSIHTVAACVALGPEQQPTPQ